jgi:hypothetical protein
MAKKKDKKPNSIEIYKSIRKEPVPPGRVIQPKNRQLEDDNDDEIIDRWMGWRGEDFEQFEDEMLDD